MQNNTVSSASVWRRFGILLVPFILLLLVSQGNAMFSDTIQFGGDVPLWYYNNNFAYFLLPDYADSGHPPGFGLYLALVWELFGKHVIVSHWAMLPAIMLLVYQAVKLGVNLLPQSKEGSLWLSILLLLSTPVMAQCTLVSPDIIVLGIVFWMLNSIWERNNWTLGIAVLLVSVISIRGMSVTVGLFVMKLWYDAGFNGAKSKLHHFFKTIRPFIFGGLLGLAYFVYHYIHKGWISPTEDTPWGSAFTPVSLLGWLKNMLVLVWRFIDLGGVALCLIVVVFVLQLVRNRSSFELSSAEWRTYRSLLLLLVVLFLLTLVPMTLYTGLLAHRYLILFASLMLMLGIGLLWNSKVVVLKYKRLIVIGALVIQLTGSFWIYPATLSQSWDCSLAHLSYFELRNEFLAYFKLHNIAQGDIVTEFPMHKSAAVLDYADNDTVGYRMLNQEDIDSVDYLWFSNVCNALLKQKAYFDSHYEKLLEKKRGSVVMIFYKKKSSS